MRHALQLSKNALLTKYNSGEDAPVLYFIFFGVITMNDNRHTENLTIHHKVKDYAVWRKGYDDHEKARHAAGITNGRVFRSAEDPNDVLILQDVADVAQARTWLGGDELKAAMTKAGVIGSPNVRFAS
jgi:hypothetical protein